MARTRQRLRSLRCPTCRKVVLRGDPEFPFCSDRCRRIDLGKWASGAYVISSPLLDPDAGHSDAAADTAEENDGAKRRSSDDQDGRFR
ncbi:MAG: DNA gyrase inhibitor YacG [Terriglobales bacterium]